MPDSPLTTPLDWALPRGRVLYFYKHDKYYPRQQVGYVSRRARARARRYNLDRGSAILIIRAISGVARKPDECDLESYLLLAAASS